MGDLALDDNWDLEIVNGDLVILDPVSTITQLLRQRLSMFLGEWFLDASKGVPYFEDVLKKDVTLEIIDSILKTVVLETPGVEDLLSFVLDYDPDGRTFSVAFQATHKNDVIDFNEEITI